MKQARPMRDSISRQVERAQAAGRTPAHLSSRSCAGTVLKILERLSAIGPMSSHSDGVGYADRKAAAPHSIAMMLGARGCALPPAAEARHGGRGGITHSILAVEYPGRAAARQARAHPPQDRNADGP